MSGELLSKSDEVVGLRLDASNTGIGVSAGYRKKSEVYLYERPEPLCVSFSSDGNRLLDCDRLEIETQELVIEQ